MTQVKGFTKYNDAYSKYYAKKYDDVVRSIIAAKACKESQAAFIDKYNERRLNTSKNFKELYGKRLGVVLSQETGVYVTIDRKVNQIHFEKYSFALIGGIIAD